MGFFSSPGLDAVKSATNQAGALAGQYSGLQSGYRKAGDTTASQLFRMPGDGGLNPYLKNQFAQEKAQIAKSYADNVGAAQKGLAQRGMSLGPSGMNASIINSANRNAGADTTAAYGEQLRNQLGLGLEGVRYNQAQQQMYSPLNPLEMQMKGGQAEQAMGASSPFSSIMKGVGTVATAMA